jgi:methylmalonyl-CoA/ethylmalonyl-CoA epimerase
MLPESMILGIDHVGIAVADLDSAADFYARAFGMAIVHEEVGEEQGVREAMLAAGPDRIQLLAPLHENSPIAKFLASSGPGVQQLAFRVKDIEAASDHLRAQGLRVLYDSPKRGTHQALVNFVHPKDCGGVLIELVQPSSNP